MDEEKYVVISHDPFARRSVVRQIVRTDDECDCCMAPNTTGRLFNYGTLADDSRRGPNWEIKRFCSISCHDQYWNQ